MNYIISIGSIIAGVVLFLSAGTQVEKGENAVGIVGTLIAACAFCAGIKLWP